MRWATACACAARAAPRNRSGRSPTSARASRASCTTWSPTTSASWSCRRRPAMRSSTTRPDQARAALAAVEETGRHALGELRRLLDVVTGDESADYDPQPGLAAARRARRIGSRDRPRRRAHGRGDAARAAAALELSAFRIVQEALTNTLKHAGATHASVRVRYGGDALEVEVADDGAARPRPRAAAGSSACASASRSSAASSPRARSPAAASPSAPACRWSRRDPRPPRRRPGARPGRLPHDPRGARRLRGRRRGRERARRGRARTR